MSTKQAKQTKQTKSPQQKDSKKPTTALEILIAARSLLSGPNAWIKGSYAAYRKGGGGCSLQEPAASCFCAAGAIRRASPYAYLETNPVGAAFKALALEIDAKPRLSHEAIITGWNDAPERTKTEVLRAFDKAIKRFQKSALAKITR